MGKEVEVIQPINQYEYKRKIRVAVYCRVSNDKEDQVNSFYAQMQYYIQYIKEHDEMELIDIYADKGITGTELKKREEMNRLLKDCKLGKIDRVLVKSVTRFARNVLECIEIVREMQSENVNVIFENDNIDTRTMNSELMLYIKGAFAQSEALNASKRMAISVKMKMEDGSYYNVSKPYGYKWDKRKLVIEEREAEVVRFIYNSYINGKSVSQIIQYLKDNGNKDRKWNPSIIRNILTNEKYTGNILWEKKYTPSQLPLRQKKNSGEIRQMFWENDHAPIIDIDTFKTAQKIRKERNEKRRKNKEKTHTVFYKKIQCGNCGSYFRQKEIKNGYTWSCRNKGTLHYTCKSRNFTDEELKENFVNFYKKLKSNSKILLDYTINQLEIKNNKENLLNNELNEIDEEINKVGKEEVFYTNLFVSKIINESTYHEKIAVIKGKLLELRSKRNKIILKNKDDNDLIELRKIKRILDKNRNNTYEFDEDLFSQLVDKIYAENDGSITFYIKGGMYFNVHDRI